MRQQKIVNIEMKNIIPCGSFHTDMQRLETAMRQEAVKRGWYSTDPILNKAKSLVQILIIRTNQAHDNVRVPTNILGHRMNN